MIFDDMIDDILSNTKPHLIVSEFLIRGRKLIISLAFVAQ